MAQLLLTLGTQSLPLQVLRFRLEESANEPFVISLRIAAGSLLATADEMIGQRACFFLSTDNTNVREASGRSFEGICTYIELVRVEADGLCTYEARLCARLALLAQRRNYRVFQHSSAPNIVRQLLDEWGVPHRWSIDELAYPRFEYRVQYGESDLNFIHRLLQHEGIAYYLAEEGSGAEATSVMIASDQLHQEAVFGAPIPFVDEPNAASRREFVTDVRASRHVRPNRVEVRDFDLRQPAKALSTSATSDATAEHVLEQFRYRPGAFRQVANAADGNTPAADDRGALRSDLAVGQRRAVRSLSADRADHAVIRFRTNLASIRPGRVITLEHPHPDVHHQRLLVTSSRYAGKRAGEWSFQVSTVTADEAYRPPFVTPQPKVRGHASALVVGPAGEEIHTDEYGRVRVQFHWDREGQRNHHSSCWVRVAEGWAGVGFGMLCLPRVGQEVLIAFEEGDPDRPLLVGRAFNGAQLAPYPLPLHRTKSVWRTSSSPGGGGYNEISHEDATAKELLYFRAERNLDKLVLLNEQASVGGQRRSTVAGQADFVTGVERHEQVQQHLHGQVGGEHREFVKLADHQLVAGERHTAIGRKDALDAGVEIHLQSGQKVIVEAGGALSFRVGDSFVHIDVEGVSLSAKQVRVNAGGAPGIGSGTLTVPPTPPLPAQPTLPSKGAASAALDTQETIPTRYPPLPVLETLQERLQRLREQRQRRPIQPAKPEQPIQRPPKKPTTEEKSWIEVCVQYDDGTPLANERYRLTTTDGRILEGTLDDEGRLQHDDLVAGECTLTLPDLDDA